ncbi:hypothetical protein EDD11_005330 [Mortierella claussenii]|nr:hypothetical protein EDD11_005330 [Mortierella claussenii]
MKSIAAITIATLALASSASAQLISYGHPIAADRWTAGQTAQVAWTNTCDQVTTGNTTFPIYLQYQVGLYQVQYPGVPALGDLDCSAAGSVDVTVPMVPQGTYSILVTDGAFQSYSAQFTIDSTIPPAANTTSGGVTSSVPLPSTTTTATSTTPLITTTAAANATTSLPSVTRVTTTATASPTKPNQAGTMKAGSTAALVVVAAIASLML